nr:hypothetical protein BgiMline_009302 [Biomphalaria glabrata]
MLPPWTEITLAAVLPSSATGSQEYRPRCLLRSQPVINCPEVLDFLSHLKFICPSSNPQYSNTSVHRYCRDSRGQQSARINLVNFVRSASCSHL